MHVHSSFFHKSQKLETTRYLSVGESMKRLCSIHNTKQYSAIKKKKRNELLLWAKCLLSPHNSSVETLIPSVMVLGTGALGTQSGRGQSPSEQDQCPQCPYKKRHRRDVLSWPCTARRQQSIIQEEVSHQIPNLPAP